MRLGPELHCNDCFERFASAALTTCPRCGTPLVDTDGREPPRALQRPPDFRGTAAKFGAPAAFAAIASALAAAIPSGTLVAGGAAAFLAAVTVGVSVTALRARGRWTRDVARRREAARRAFAGEDGMVTQRGRVRIVDGVSMPGDGRRVAAYVVDGEHRTGRFGVVAENQVAVVDDDWLEIWQADTAGGPGEWGGPVDEGVEVVVAGRARRGVLTDAALVAGFGGHRDMPDALELDGSTKEPVRVLVFSAVVRR